MEIMRAWDAGRNKVAFAHRDKETGRVNIGEEKFEWYFYVKTCDFQAKQPFFKKLKDSECVNKYEDDGIYTKVFVDQEHASHLFDKDCNYVWEYRNKKLNYCLKMMDSQDIKHYEADVQLYLRWILDNDIKYDTNLRVLFLDIETDDSKISGQPVPGEFQILSCSFVDGQTGKTSWICCDDWGDESEKALLMRIAKILNGYDVFVAWNGIAFDFAYIKARMTYHGIQIDWRKKFLQDQMLILKKLGSQLPSYSLDNVSKFYLKDKGGKVETGKKIFQLFNEDREMLKKYNIQDSVLMYGIEDKTGFLAAAREINAVGYCPCDDQYVSRKIDRLVLRQAMLDKHYHFQTKERGQEEETEKFKGAFVVEPIPGLYENVQVLDFASLYPNTIISFNISPDTIVNDGDNVPEDQIITTPAGHKFRKDFEGILPKIIKITSERREYFKNKRKGLNPESSEYKMYDKLQYVYKYFGLSFYGVLGLNTIRFFDIRVAESVTLTGQYFIKKVMNYCEKNISPVIYGDTDSFFFQLAKRNVIPVVIENIRKICAHEAIKNFNCDKCTLEMSDDKFFFRFLSCAKKRYAGSAISLDGKDVDDLPLYVAGLEYKRTDVAKIVRTKQEELLKLLLKTKNFTEADARTFIDDLKKYIFSGNVELSDIMLSQKITKDLDDYEGRQMHKMVAEEMMKDGKEVYTGDKIQYFIKGIDQKNKPIPAPTYKYEGKFDKMYMWNNKIFPAFERILVVVFPKIKWDSYYLHLKPQQSGSTGRMLW